MINKSNNMAGENRMNTYLSQQMNLVDDDNTQLQRIQVPTDSELAEFKQYVQNYIEIDNDVKKLKAAIKERNSVKKEISSFILKFMSKFNIEDLNTKQGKIRYKITQSKKPISQTAIKNRMIEMYDPNLSAEALAEKVFEGERTVVEKHSLRRL